jgi:hypothetical protein
VAEPIGRLGDARLLSERVPDPDGPVAPVRLGPGRLCSWGRRGPPGAPSAAARRSGRRAAVPTAASCEADDPISGQRPAGRRGSSASAPGRGATRRQAPHEHRSGQETPNNSATRGKIEPGPLFIHLPPPPPARTGTARPAAPATPVCPSFAGHPYDPQEDGWSATPNEVRREVQTRPAASAEAASRAGAGAGGCRERPHPVRGPLERPLESVVHAASSVSYDDPVASQRSGPAKRSETHDSARVIEMRRLR